MEVLDRHGCAEEGNLHTLQSLVAVRKFQAHQDELYNRKERYLEPLRAYMCQKDVKNVLYDLLSEQEAADKEDFSHAPAAYN